MEYDSLQAATWPGGEGPRWCRPVSMLRAFVGINACVPQSLPRSSICANAARTTNLLLCEFPKKDAGGHDYECIFGPYAAD